jgi:hypothetical protein
MFLLREPEATIKSIITMGQRDGIEKYANVKFATDYYCSRISKLADYSSGLREYILIESDDITHDTQSVLHKISQWLLLDLPLTSEYKTFNKTGKLGAGDTSSNLGERKIVETYSNQEIQLPANDIEKAKRTYHCAIEKIKNGAGSFNLCS